MWTIQRSGCQPGCGRRWRRERKCKRPSDAFFTSFLAGMPGIRCREAAKPLLWPCLTLPMAAMAGSLVLMLVAFVAEALGMGGARG